MRGLWGISALALSLGLAGVASAQEADTPPAEGDITVTATRVAQDSFDVPSAVSVITAQEIEENLYTDIKDLVRFEPGVSVTSSPARFNTALSSTGRDGNAGFTIRGLGGNRVLFQVDGVRVPDGFDFGPIVFGRGDYVDLDLLHSVEILRGPGSALYGSDGLAGVVSFTTKSPSEFLGEGEQFGGRARIGYASADDSLATGLSLAGRWGDWSALASYTHREAHEQDSQGENDVIGALRTTPNPQDITSDSAMARLVFEPSAMHRFRLTGEYGQREAFTDALSSRSTPPATATLLLTGDDTNERERVALDYTYSGDGSGFIDDGFAAIYYQTSTTRQFTFEDRNPAADRSRDNTFDNEVWGVSGQATSHFATGAATHTLTYGGDYSSTHQEGIRTGTTPPFGETFPSRPFPNTDFTLAGVFLQDEISFMDGRVSFFPAVRYDAFEIEGERDPLYPASIAIADQSDSRVTPRFGVVAWPTETVGVFFNYAQGFKAPAPSQVNNAFTNIDSGYTSIPNPNLQPETSESVELGVRLRDTTVLGADLRAQASTFMAQYDDFIEQVQFGNFGDPAIFQYVNLSQVEIWGLEGRADLTWANGFGLTLSAAFAEGEEVDPITGRTPLASIDPFKLVTGLTYNDPDGRFGGQAIVTYSSAKERSDVASATTFRPDSFAILDLTAYWNITDAATLRAGVFNATDETYWWWSDARGLSSTSAVLDAFTQPGRNVSVSVAYRF
ncbi:MAG: TonB-dependent hemoglobin/transferrin/lactoferrin family receptor [Hyphomonadaceae bacterium]|nr:TonB-dependent hemoglobin/transferrin/lactoferrin family receptor [Hyphomonadaceae bacterium]